MSQVPAAAPPARFAVFDGDLDADWQALYSGARALAVDTEAMGLVHGRDRLCLVQIADEHDNVCCLRLARGQSGAPRLQALLGPAAGLLYRRRAARAESVELRLMSDDQADGSTLRLRAHRDELIAIERELGPRLQLASDGSLLHSPI